MPWPSCDTSIFTCSANLLAASSEWACARIVAEILTSRPPSAWIRTSPYLWSTLTVWFAPSVKVCRNSFVAVLCPERPASTGRAAAAKTRNKPANFHSTPCDLGSTLILRLQHFLERLLLLLVHGQKLIPQMRVRRILPGLRAQFADGSVENHQLLPVTGHERRRGRIKLRLGVHRKLVDRFHVFTFGALHFSQCRTLQQLLSRGIVSHTAVAVHVSAGNGKEQDQRAREGCLPDRWEAAPGRQFLPPCGPRYPPRSLGDQGAFNSRPQSRVFPVITQLFCRNAQGLPRADFLRASRTRLCVTLEPEPLFGRAIPKNPFPVRAIDSHDIPPAALFRGGSSIPRRFFFA